ncbi:hypothetical protein GCM10029964_065710 [Kibdelosporangium lantanae]
MLVFLLSANGVRQVEVDLDFMTGTIYDERRRSFGYDKLTSAEVLEQGFQSAKGQRHRVRKGDDVLHVTDKEEMVINRTFELILNSGRGVQVEVDNYDGLLDDTTDEDRTQLDRVALDSSGVTSALQILEAVAAEGREWIVRERERRNRHWQEWAEWKTHALREFGTAITENVRPLAINPVPEPQRNH